MSNKNLTQKAVVGILVALFIGGSVATGSYYWATKESAVARINGEAITYNEFLNAVNNAKNQYAGQIGMDFDSEVGKTMLATLKKQVLEGMIDRTLLRQQAGELGVIVEPSEVDQKLEEFIQDNYRKDRSAFERDLTKNRFTLADFKVQLRDRLLVNKVYQHIIKDIKVTDQMIKEYYESHHDFYTKPESIQAKHILIKTEKRSEEEAQKKAQEILQKIKAGAEFEKMAKEYSEDDSNKNTGGDLGAFQKEDMVQPFSEAAWKLKQGEITDTPVKTQFGFHLIKRGKTIPGKTMSLDESKDNIRSQLEKKEQQQKFETWMKKLRENSKIDVKDEVTAPPPPKAETPATTPTDASPAKTDGK